MSKTKLDKAEQTFRELKAKYQAGDATALQYKNGKAKLSEVRADYRANVRDAGGWAAVKTGD